MLGKSSASPVSQQNIFLSVCSLAMRRGRLMEEACAWDPGALKLCGLELSHTGQVVPSCVEVRQWPVMKGERLPVSFPLPQLDLLSLWYCLLMEDYEGWEDRRNFPSFESLMQMTPLKGRSCWEPACSCRAVSHGARVNLGKQLWDTGLDNAWNGGGLLKLSKSTC